MNKVFLDTSFAIALSADRDKHHQRAEELADELEAANTSFVTTRAILLEIGNALSKLRYRSAAMRLLTTLENDPKFEIVSLSEELYHRALELYGDRVDKEWGLIDCISFVVMKDQGLTKALTTDNHFQQAGFQILL
ncbi:MAG TPA: type II toxin-antitoxin system VapC family toxin [Pyrinomonadaceae bacterium]|nr:type II toxin-antitoxin system VapC family toxin [Pyrinomonadaceae bacterium]